MKNVLETQTELTEKKIEKTQLASKKLVESTHVANLVMTSAQNLFKLDEELLDKIIEGKIIFSSNESRMFLKETESQKNVKCWRLGAWLDA